MSGQTVSVTFQENLGGGNAGLLAGVDTTITFRVRAEPQPGSTNHFADA